MPKKNNESMRIITINVPQKWIKYIDLLTDEKNGMYSSRSEVCRMALHEFITKEIALMNTIEEITNDDPNIVIVPDLGKFKLLSEIEKEKKAKTLEQYPTMLQKVKGNIHHPEFEGPFVWNGEDEAE